MCGGCNVDNKYIDIQHDLHTLISGRQLTAADSGAVWHVSKVIVKSYNPTLITFAALVCIQLQRTVQIDCLDGTSIMHLCAYI